MVHLHRMTSMSLRLLFRLGALLVLTSAACGPAGGDDDPMMDIGPDADGDGIADAIEGTGDFDGDGIPDFKDTDSDGDGIEDSVEAGIITPGGNPQDTDEDGIPDYLDLDSDGNEILDADEGSEDLDADGKPDFADKDNDGDLIPDIEEIAGIPQSPGTPRRPADSDGDGIPNYLDIDSDGDFIKDEHEGSFDPDKDRIPSYLDEDSDGDCLPDAREAGDSILATPPQNTDDDDRPNFHDVDSDNDGLSDPAEDPNCNGILDPGETRTTDDDTDDDGVSDLIEVAAGTNPQDPARNPRADGNFVFITPYEEDTKPSADDLGFETDVGIADIYLLVDRSGSMVTEINNIVDNIVEVARNITCAPLGEGTPGECIEDVFWGAGTVGYTRANGDSYEHNVDMNSNPALVGSINTTTLTGTPHVEPIMLATYSALTGENEVGASCPIADEYSTRFNCAGSPAGAGGVGYPCFRTDALPIILLATDEPPMNSPSADTLACPSQSTLCSAANDISARIIGIKGAASVQDQTPLHSDLTALATCTGAVDSNGDALVENGNDANAAAAIENAIRAVARGVPLDLTADLFDVSGDSVNAVTEFISHIETQQLGSAECTGGHSDVDTDGDGRPDRYLDVVSGSPVCWRLVPKMNTTIEPDMIAPKMFEAGIEIRGDGTTLLDQRRIFFLVPPVFPDVDIIVD